MMTEVAEKGVFCADRLDNSIILLISWNLRPSVPYAEKRWRSTETVQSVNPVQG
jgi:hypothetical protein